MIICQNCGKSIIFDTSKCPYCGHVLDAPIDFPRDEFLVSDSTLVKYIGKNKNVRVPFGIKEIGCRAFCDCENIQTITLPDGLETISDEAFYDCEEVHKITIPCSVEQIGKNVFEGCWSLEEVHFDGRLADWNDMVELDQTTSEFVLVTPDLITGFTDELENLFEAFPFSVEVSSWGKCSLILPSLETVNRLFNCKVPESYALYILKNGTIAVCTDLSSDDRINQVYLSNVFANGDPNNENIVKWTKQGKVTPVIGRSVRNVFQGYSSIKRSGLTNFSLDDMVRVMLGDEIHFIEDIRQNLLEQVMRFI